MFNDIIKQTKIECPYCTSNSVKNRQTGCYDGKEYHGIYECQVCKKIFKVITIKSDIVEVRGLK